MRILGIDPGINNLGWALLEKNKQGNINYLTSGKISPVASDHITIRLAYLFASLSNLILEHKPELAAIEDVFINSNAKSSMILSYARGTLLSCLGYHQLKTLEFASTTIKKTIVGNGKADKDQVMKMLRLVIPNVKFSSSDEADAIAIGYTGLVSSLPIKGYQEL